MYFITENLLKFLNKAGISTDHPSPFFGNVKELIIGSQKQDPVSKSYLANLRSSQV